MLFLFNNLKCIKDETCVSFVHVLLDNHYKSYTGIHKIKNCKFQVLLANHVKENMSGVYS